MLEAMALHESPASGKKCSLRLQWSAWALRGLHKAVQRCPSPERPLGAEAGTALDACAGHRHFKQTHRQTHAGGKGPACEVSLLQVMQRRATTDVLNLDSAAPLLQRC